MLHEDLVYFENLKLEPYFRNYLSDLNIFATNFIWIMYVKVFDVNMNHVYR